jgi:heme exporter protein A
MTSSTAATNTQGSTAATNTAAGSTAVEGPSGGPAGGEAGNEPAIELAGLRRDFGERPALVDVSIRLETGRSLAVLGPNGSGKTTLLRILAGLLRPSGGVVSVLGCSLPKETNGLRGRVGYLGHQPLLYRDLTPRENLALTAALHALEPDAADRRIEELLDAVGMARRADDRVAELSAGMRQRIDICRAILHAPPLLLLDEPDAHLDAEARRLIEPLIATRPDRSRVVVSHDREAATAGADSVLELG